MFLFAPTCFRRQSRVIFATSIFICEINRINTIFFPLCLLAVKAGLCNHYKNRLICINRDRAELFIEHVGSVKCRLVFGSKKQWIAECVLKNRTLNFSFKSVYTLYKFTPRTTRKKIKRLFVIIFCSRLKFSVDFVKQIRLFYWSFI